MSSALSEFFKTRVDPHRATLLVQGGHGSGKSTLLNALLGLHAFPYFVTPRTDTNETSTTAASTAGSRYCAGTGATAICYVNAAKCDGDTVAMDHPSSGTIQHVIVPSALTPLPQDSLGRPVSGLEIATETEPTPVLGREDTADSAHAFQEDESQSYVGLDGCGAGRAGHVDPSAFLLVENLYRADSSTPTSDFDVVEDAWVHRPKQAFFYDAVASMEASWKEWRATLPSVASPRALTATTNVSTGGDALPPPERMLFVIRVNQSEEAAIDNVTHKRFVTDQLPLLNVVESTDLSDRPPMTYVHSNIVVLSDDVETLSQVDHEGAARMYIQAALFTRANAEPILVYNLVTRNTADVSKEELDRLRSALAKKWNVTSSCVYILNLRRALADVMLAHEGIPPMNPADTSELERLKTQVARNHSAAHERFLERMQVAEKRRLEKEHRDRVLAAAATAEAIASGASTTITLQVSVSSPTQQTATSSSTSNNKDKEQTTSNSKKEVAPQSVVDQDAYVPKALSEVYSAEGLDLAKRVTEQNRSLTTAAAATPTVGTTASPSLPQQSYIPQVCRHTCESEAAAAAAAAAADSKYVPKCLSANAANPSVGSNSYVPRIVQHAAAPVVVGGSDYTPKCVEPRTVVDTTVQHRMVAGSSNSSSAAKPSPSPSTPSAADEPVEAPSCSIPSVPPTNNSHSNSSVEQHREEDTKEKPCGEEEDVLSLSPSQNSTDSFDYIIESD